MAKQIVENVVMGAAERIDPESGTLFGVKILGEHSLNNRRYTPDAMRNATSLYEGKKSYVNHPSRDSSDDRSFESWAGTLRSVHYREGKGLFADIQLRKKSSHFEGILEAATDFPNDAGFSHVAEADSRWDDGTEIIESIEAVFSVDLVTDPATTAGFFESKENTMPAKKKQKVKFGALLEKASPKHSKLLIEMLDPVLSADAEVEETSTDPAESVADALAPAVVKIFMDPAISPVETGKQVAKLAKAVEDVKAQMAPTPMADESPDPETPDESPTEESAEVLRLRTSNLRLEAKTFLLESGCEATEARIGMIGKLSHAERKEITDLFRGQSSGDDFPRPGSSPPKFKEANESFGDSDYSDRWKESVKKAKA